MDLSKLSSLQASLQAQTVASKASMDVGARASPADLVAFKVLSRSAYALVLIAIYG
jgi:hypothetical protein